MGLNPGSRLGVYEVAGLLGSGGMGEVYRARDTKLRRDVALKVLPDALRLDTVRRARFDLEAHVLASLSHPNIAAIYGIEETEGTGALVLELVEGETLATRIARGPIPVTEALSIARQIAEALAAAHEKGIVHRDLKPANITITPTGLVKVLDFGLAKIAAPTDAAVDETRTAGHTRDGMVVGTAAYMSPEQARGQAVDKRTDLWAFGCVLYEMLTGRRLFEGGSATETLAFVLTKDPDWSALPPQVPRAVRALLLRCLERERVKRLADVSAIRFVLDEVASLSVQGADDGEPAERTRQTRARRIREAIAWGLAAAGIAIAAGLGILQSSEPVSSRRPITFTVAAPPDTFLRPAVVSQVNQSALTMSPDGNLIAFLARRGSEQLSIWIRSLDSLEVRHLAGTEGAAHPFWSADSRGIGFYAAGKLRTIDLAGGPVQELCAAPTFGGGTWNREGTILFQPNQDGPLHRVSSRGGACLPLTSSSNLPSGQSTSARFPSFLPDGRHFLFFRPPATVMIGSLDSPDTSRILNADSAAVYASGYVLFRRQEMLLAQRFDPDRLALSGEAVPVAKDVAAPSSGGRSFSASAGVLAYRKVDAVETELRWFDREGQ